MIWKFKNRIEFGESSKLYSKLKRMKSAELIIDLTKTEYVHSSFIGFLIYVHTRLEKAGRALIVQPSPEVKKILRNKNILDFFILTLPEKSSYQSHYPLQRLYH